MNIASTEAYPLTWPAGWPRTATPQRSQFKHTNHYTTLALIDEIRRLGGRQVVLSTNQRLRQDGLPYAADRPPADKGVAVYFTFKGKQMVFACDKWDKLHDNIQSIRKTIEALRGVERWGASDMMERAFNGFLALEHQQSVLVPRTCWDVLELQPGAGRAEIADARRSLARRYHPDMGLEPDASRMAEVNQAADEAAKLIGA